MDRNFIGDALSYEGPSAPVYEMLTPLQQRFFDAISNDDDLIAVLRGHLYVESAVNDLLAILFPGADVLIGDLTYEQKVRRLRKATSVPSMLGTLLKALGELRNSFAHSLERRLTQADDGRFSQPLDSQTRQEVSTLIARGAFPDQAGSSVRAAIIVLYTHLSVMRLVLSKQAKEKIEPGADKASS